MLVLRNANLLYCLIIFVFFVLSACSSTQHQSVPATEQNEAANKAIRQSYERGRQIWNDSDLGANGRSCLSCHVNGEMTNAEKYPRYKHILRTMATISMTHNFAVVNESKGEAWEIGSEDANAIALFVQALANGKKMKMIRLGSIDDEWFTKGSAAFIDASLGSNGKSCATCHSLDGKMRKSNESGRGPDLKGIAAYYPRYSPNFKRVIITEQQINYCITQYMQGAPQKLDSELIVSLYYYLARKSEGTKISVARFE